MNKYLNAVKGFGRGLMGSLAGNNPQASGGAMIGGLGGGGNNPAALGGMMGGLFNLNPVMAQQEIPTPDQLPKVVATETEAPKQMGLLENIGAWAKQNPALFKGLVTAGVGLAGGMNAADYLGLGGRVTTQTQADLQREMEESVKLKLQLLGSLGKNDKPLSEYYSAARSMLGNKATAEQINKTAAAIKAQDMGATINYQNTGIPLFNQKQMPYIQGG